MSDKYSEIAKQGYVTNEMAESLEKESDALFENAKAVFTDFYKKNINTAFAQNIFTESRWARQLNA